MCLLPLPFLCLLQLCATGDASLPQATRQLPPGPRTHSLHELQRAYSTSCISGEGVLHPIHSKVLSVMLSMLMSGATSAAWGALEGGLPSPLLFSWQEHPQVGCLGRSQGKCGGDQRVYAAEHRGIIVAEQNRFEGDMSWPWPPPPSRKSFFQPQLPSYNAL